MAARVFRAFVQSRSGSTLLPDDAPLLTSSDSQPATQRKHTMTAELVALLDEGSARTLIVLGVGR